MGTVFVAEQIAVGNRRVALKVLNLAYLDGPEFIQRFQNEAGSTGRIHHHNVVTVYESGQGDDGTPYIAMEFLEGSTLGEVLRQRGALPFAEAVEIVKQAARGLNAAHELGIIHRDLKPDNIFLTHGDEGERVVKVLDFGIARLRESTVRTVPGTVLGTPAYMSVEQASGMTGDELDARSDVYSLGVVAYEMLTGSVPFRADTLTGYMRMHKEMQPPPFSAFAQGLSVPPAIESAVMKALAKDPDERYASALDFGRELTKAAQLVPLAQGSAKQDLTEVCEPIVRDVKLPFETTVDLRGLVRKRSPGPLPRSENELAQAKAEEERLPSEKSEAESRNPEKGVPEQKARENAEQDPLARQKAEQQRLAREAAAALYKARKKRFIVILAIILTIYFAWLLHGLLR
jgi:serine/threonine protein kinase